MTRESAQKHAALIRAFAAGHDIEKFSVVYTTWEKRLTPDFDGSMQYRIALPPNKSYHNPENITEEQLGKNHRFCLLEELDGRFIGFSGFYNGYIWIPSSDANLNSRTYRVPIETLFPTSPPTPKTRPFTVDDITPNMVFRHMKENSGFQTLGATCEDHVILNVLKHTLDYKLLSRDWLYSTDGKTFHPCSVNL